MALSSELETLGLSMSLGECWQIIPELMEEDPSLKEEYIGNLVKLYLFVALGAGSTIYTAFKNKK